MARVPVYDGAQVRSNALQPVQQREVDVSSGLRAAGQALTQVSEVVDRKVRDEADLEAFGAQERILKAQNDWEVKARSIAQGEKAVGYRAQVEDWWKTTREQEFQKLSPLAQQRAARALSAAYRASVDSAGSYERQQVEIGARAKLGGTTAQLQTQAIKAGPTGAGAVLAAGIETIRAYGQERGIDVSTEVTKFTSNVHLNMIDAMAQTNAAEARRYFTENRDQIDSGTWDRVDKVIVAEGLNQEAKGLAAKNAGKTLAEQLAVGAGLAPELRERYLTEVRNNHAMVKQAQAEQEQGASDEAWQLVGRGKRVPETVLMRMNGRERVQLQEHLADRARQAADRAEGKSLKTDWATYIDAREKLAAGEKVDLRLLTTKIAPAQLEQLLDIQTKRNDPKKAPEVATSEQQVGAMTRTMDLKGERLGQFQAAAYDRFNAHLAAKGKEPDYTERQKILDQLTQDVVTDKGWLWDSKAPAYQAPREVRNQLPLPTVEKFTVGKAYTDSKGNRAVYRGNGQWEPVK